MTKSFFFLFLFQLAIKSSYERQTNHVENMKWKVTWNDFWVTKKTIDHYHNRAHKLFSIRAHGRRCKTISFFVYPSIDYVFVISQNNIVKQKKWFELLIYCEQQISLVLTSREKQRQFWTSEWTQRVKYGKKIETSVKIQWIKSDGFQHFNIQNEFCLDQMHCNEHVLVIYLKRKTKF